MRPTLAIIQNQAHSPLKTLLTLQFVTQINKGAIGWKLKQPLQKTPDII